MTINPRTNAVELTTEEVRKAVTLYLQQGKFNIRCKPDDVELSQIPAISEVAAFVMNWDNEIDEASKQEDIFLVNSR